VPAAASAPPSIYQNMAGMAMGAKPPAGAPKPGEGPAGAGGGMEEKKQILTTLLEVFKKWDKLESDESGKKIISDMMMLAERYKKEVLKEGGPSAEGGTPGAGDTPPPPPPDASGSGAGGAKGKGPDVPA